MKFLEIPQIIISEISFWPGFRWVPAFVLCLRFFNLQACFRSVYRDEKNIFGRKWR